jgi:membrane protease YdiL (CAAX protease family)
MEFPAKQLRQLFTYFALAYFISWTIWLPLYGPVFGITSLPTFPLNHAAGGLGPLIASFLTTWFFQRKDGVKKIFAQCLQLKPLIYLAIALFSPFILALVASLVSYFIDGNPVTISGLLANKEFPEWSFLTFLFYNLIFFGFGEEVGWRGFALPGLQYKLNALAASIMLTMFWALWHLPLFFYRPGYTNLEFTGIAGWVFSLLTGSILLSWLYNSSGGSILICAVFHSTVDIAFTAGIADKNIVNYMGFLITVWGILTIIIFKPKYLARQLLKSQSNKLKSIS